MGKFPSKKGNRVRFGAPNDVTEKGGGAVYGTVLDEVWADQHLNCTEAHAHPCKWGTHCWGDYSFFSQLIGWDDHRDEPSIRLGYYRRRCGEDNWRFASQMTINAEPEVIENLLAATLAKRDWFQPKR